MEQAAQSDVKETRAIIDALKAKQFAPRLEHVRGSYLFEVSGVGSWRFDVDHGKIAVKEGAGTADCIVRTDPADFVRIARGEQNLITGFMQGRVQLEGDPALAQKLHGLLPGPANERSSGAKGGQP